MFGHSYYRDLKVSNKTNECARYNVCLKRNPNIMSSPIINDKISSFK